MTGTHIDSVGVEFVRFFLDSFDGVGPGAFCSDRIGRQDSKTYREGADKAFCGVHNMSNIALVKRLGSGEVRVHPEPGDARDEPQNDLSGLPEKIEMSFVRKLLRRDPSHADPEMSTPFLEGCSPSSSSRAADTIISRSRIAVVTLNFSTLESALSPETEVRLFNYLTNSLPTDVPPQRPHAGSQGAF